MQKSIEIDTNSYWGYSRIAPFYLREGDYEQAEYYSRKMLEKSVEYKYIQSLANRYLGHALAEQNKLRESIPHYKKAIDLTPGDMMAYNGLGAVYRELEKIDSAEYWLKKSVEADSNNWKAYSMIAAHYRLIEDFKKSEYYSRKIIEKSNDDVSGRHRGLSYLYRALINQKKFDEIEFITSELFALPISVVKKGDVHSLSFLLWENEQEELVEKVLITGIKKFPDDPINYYNYSCLLSLKNDQSGALDQLENAMIKGYNYFEEIQKDNDLDNVRNTPEFKALMKKHFPEQYKD